jgi:hypothetical protein
MPQFRRNVLPPSSGLKDKDKGKEERGSGMKIRKKSFPLNFKEAFHYFLCKIR